MNYPFWEIVRKPNAGPTPYFTLVTENKEYCLQSYLFYTTFVF